MLIKSVNQEDKLFVKEARKYSDEIVFASRQ